MNAFANLTGLARLDLSLNALRTVITNNELIRKKETNIKENIFVDNK